MKCYISSTISSKNILSDVLDELTGLGFRNIELTGNIKYSKDIEKIIRSYRLSSGIDFIIHNYFPFTPDEFVLNLATGDSDIKKKTIDHIKRAVDFLRKTGKDLYGIHPGFRNDLLPNLKDYFFIKSGDKPNNEKDFYDNVEYISTNIIKDGFRIAVENIHPKSSSDLYSFICAPEDIERFLNYFKRLSNIGILLDLGHFNIASRRLNFNRDDALNKIIKKNQRRIFEMHISENDGLNDTHNLTEPDSWQIEFLKNNKQCLKDALIVFEWHNSANRETFEKYEIIKEKLEIS